MPQRFFFMVCAQMIVKLFQSALHLQMVCWYLNCLYMLCYCSYHARIDNLLKGLLPTFVQTVVGLQQRISFHERLKCRMLFPVLLPFYCNGKCNCNRQNAQLSPTLPQIKTYWADVSRVVIWNATLKELLVMKYENQKNHLQTLYSLLRFLLLKLWTGIHPCWDKKLQIMRDILWQLREG